MSVVLRQARREDIPRMHQVRMSVRENRLSTLVLSESDYVLHIESLGRGWVVDDGAAIVGFAVGNAATGNIWALFVHPDHERRGYGRLLHTAMVEWLWEQGLDTLWLTTATGTRAQRFYEASGWRPTGDTPSGELRLELRRGLRSHSIDV